MDGVWNQELQLIIVLRGIVEQLWAVCAPVSPQKKHNHTAVSRRFLQTPLELNLTIAIIRNLTQLNGLSVNCSCVCYQYSEYLPDK